MSQPLQHRTASRPGRGVPVDRVRRPAGSAPDPHRRGPCGHPQGSASPHRSSRKACPLRADRHHPRRPGPHRGCPEAARHEEAAPHRRGYLVQRASPPRRGRTRAARAPAGRGDDLHPREAQAALERGLSHRWSRAIPCGCGPRRRQSPAEETAGWHDPHRPVALPRKASAAHPPVGRGGPKVARTGRIEVRGATPPRRRTRKAAQLRIARLGPVQPRRFALQRIEHRHACRI